MSILNKAVLILAVLVIVAVLSLLGVQAYGDKRVAQAELNGVKEVVSEAVAARTEAGKVDAHQAKEIVTKRDTVRRIVQRGRDESKAVPIECVDVVGDSERIRLLNLQIAAVNTVIAESGELPD